MPLRATNHIECRSCRNSGIAPLDIFHANSGQGDRDNHPESQYFLHKSGHVRDFLFHEALLPRITVGVHFHDLGVSALLDFLAVRGGEISHSHNEVSWNCVETRGDHGEADGFDLG